jgi:IS5 family transposase
MKNFVDFGQKEAYKRVEQLGDRLAEIESAIDWEAFVRPIVGDMFDNRSGRGGRPNIDDVVMVKLLVPLSSNGTGSLSDPDRTREAGCG